MHSAFNKICTDLPGFGKKLLGLNVIFHSENDSI